MTLAFNDLERPSTYEWSSLPVQLQLQIFGYVAEKQKYRAADLGRCTCVSSEWQDYFEKFTFRRLLIDNSNWPGSPRNNQRFTHSLNGLFHVLRRWKPSSNWDTGLILEITAYSPGDNECSQVASMEYDLHENFQLEEDLESSPSFPEFMDAKEARDLLAPGKNWHRPMTMQGLERLQGTPLELSTRRNFKQVPIILHKTLTSVASLRLGTVSGPYIRFHRTSRIPVDYNNLILQLPHHIRRFSFNLFPRSPTEWDILFIDATPALPESLVEKAHHLVSLRPPGGMNSLNFILHLRKSQLPQKLEHRSKLAQLCLEVPDEAYGDVSLFQEQINRFLRESAVTARHLPKLQILEIWWHDRINACIFRYELEKDQVTITWRVTEDRVTLEGDSIQQWVRLAQKYNVGFSVKKEPFLRVTRGGMHIDGKIIYRHLKLCDLAADPVTLAYVETSRAW
ncbi:uncharacterized protein FRV6_14379 [Fusarium oxysporum]|uniref:DUF6546 domain-containing protein n=1 Tax=Fusarium oxysporum TaxID=5507 RepID=A0A2H3TWZ2_FUSOX|nr:uncharacterized protein FRV6_14379 [Fusarium oxysporum]